MSLLKPFYGTMPKDSMAEEEPEVEETEEILQPEQILAHRQRKVKGQICRRYLVKFKNYQSLDAKWMEEGDLADNPQLLDLYLEAFSLERTLISPPPGRSAVESDVVPATEEGR